MDGGAATQTEPCEYRNGKHNQRMKGATSTVDKTLQNAHERGHGRRRSNNQARYIIRAVQLALTEMSGWGRVGYGIENDNPRRALLGPSSAKRELKRSE